MGNCESKIYNIGMGCCVPVLAPIENYYTKWQTERYVSGFTYSKEEIDAKTSGNTSGCCITPEEVDEKIASAKTEIEAEIPSLDGYATQEWVEDKHYLTEHQSLSAYSTTEEINNAIEEATSGKADINAVTAVNNALTAHTRNTTIHVTAEDKSNWNNKANVWCGSEADWSLISGGTLDNNTIYLVY